MKIAALILAAGSGARLGGDVPKQYQFLGHQSVLQRVILTFNEHPDIACTLPVIGVNDHKLFYEQADKFDCLSPVVGGATRQESVRIGLAALEAHKISHVLIHDAARCMVSAGLISDVIAHLKTFQGGILPCVAVNDTIKKASTEMHVDKTVDRSQLWRAQTPQGFPYRAIVEAHERFKDRPCTDDAEIAEQAEIPVKIIAGDEANIKITTQTDLDRLSFQLSKQGQNAVASQLRIGTGFDVHRFTDGDHVMLCGIKIPHTRALKGHSDADVALHALTDAILGALALGDIGDYFPPSDSQWKGKESSFFFEYAIGLMKKAGGRLSNIDLTIICEEPKITPHKATMRQNLATLTGLNMELISVKATTTEGLGFTGRSEGIAVQASLAIMM